MRFSTARSGSDAAAGPPAGRRLTLLACLAAAAWVPGCVARSDDPSIRVLGRALARGERLILARCLDPGTADRIAAVVRTGRGLEELRIYEMKNGRPAATGTFREGDRFSNLVTEDVNGDEREEILAVWASGHLEVLQVIGRTADGTYATLFQNGGQEIERRHGPGGLVEFWITGRTYEEAEGQPPVYGTTVYRWDGKAFSEASRPGAAVKR